MVAKGHRPGYLEEEERMYPAGLVRLADVCWTQDPSVSTTRRSVGKPYKVLGRPVGSDCSKTISW